MTVTARKAWTDERLDDLSARIEKRFDQIDARFDRIETRFDALQRTMIVGFVGMTASIVASVIGGVLAALALN